MSDTEPDFGSEQHLERIRDAEEGCSFCGHTDHTVKKCPARWDSYSDPMSSVGRRKRDE